MSDLMDKLVEKKIIFTFYVLIASLIIIYLFNIIELFIIAFIITYLTNPLKRYLNKYLNNNFSSFFSIIIFILGVISVLILILPIIIYQVQNLIISLPAYLSELETFLKAINTKYLLSEKIKAVDYTTLFKPLTKSLIISGNNLVSNSVEFLNSFLNIILIIVITFYLSLEFNNIKSFIYNFANKSNLRDFPELIREIDKVLSKFIRGQGLVCITLSSFYAFFLFLVGMKFGVLLGIFAGIISFIPYVGAFLGGGLALILGFMQFGVSSEIIFILAIFVFGQLLESYFLTPRLVGEAIRLNPIWIIFALLTGGYLAGFVGLLISLPVAAILGVLVRFYYLKLYK